MESAVAALLLLTSTVIIACVVVVFAVNIIESTISTESYPQISALKQLSESILNDTSSSLYGNTTTNSSSPTG